MSNDRVPGTVQVKHHRFWISLFDTTLTDVLIVFYIGRKSVLLPLSRLICIPCAGKLRANFALKLLKYRFKTRKTEIISF